MVGVLHQDRVQRLTVLNEKRMWTQAKYVVLRVLSEVRSFEEQCVQSDAGFFYGRSERYGSVTILRSFS